MDATDTVSPSEALFGFMGWLTSREERSGPFSARHDAGAAALLVGEYCKEQGFADPREGWKENIKPMPKKDGKHA
jgi:hypothetical protein